MSDKLSNTNRVTPEHVNRLFHTLEYRYERVGDTTTTGCWAFLPLPGGKEFQVGYGESACVDPANYIKSTGEHYARERCETAAKDKIWELEGYALATTGKVSEI